MTNHNHISLTLYLSHGSTKLWILSITIRPKPTNTYTHSLSLSSMVLDYFLFWIFLVECGGEATVLYAELDGDVRVECFCGDLGSYSRIRVRWMG